MDKLFMKILDMSISAALVIAAVLLFRLLLKRAPKVFSYALWAVVLLRLLCPLSIELPVSAMPEIEPVEEHYTLTDVPISPVDAGVAAYQAVGDALNGGLGIQHVQTTIPNDAGGVEVVQTDWWEIWILFGQYLWLAGAAAMALWGVLSYIRLRRKLVGALSIGEGVYIADHIPTPFVVGIFRPRIYLPSALPAREYEYVLLHERHHIRRLDHVVKLLAYAALCVHWFNPLVWLAFVLAGKDMEMSCDEAVIKKLGGDIRAAYSASLLSLAAGRRIAAMPLAFGEGDTKGRVKNLAKWKKPALWVMIAAAVACVVLAVCLLTDPVETTDSFTLKEVDTSNTFSLNYELDLGEEIGGGHVVAELWKNGECVRSAPMQFTQYAKELSILMAVRKEDGRNVGVDIQLTTDQAGGSLLTYFPLPEYTDGLGWAMNGYEKGDKVELQPGESKHMAAMSFDFGEGVRTVDMQTLDTEPERLEAMQYTIVIRAEFTGEPLEDVATGPADELLLIESESGDGYSLSYAINLGRAIDGGTVFLELWENGKFVRETPLEFTQYDETLNIKLAAGTPSKDDGRPGVDAEVVVDNYDKSVAWHIGFPDEHNGNYAEKLTSYELYESIGLRPGDIKTLASLYVDLGDGKSMEIIVRVEFNGGTADEWGISTSAKSVTPTGCVFSITQAEWEGIPEITYGAAFALEQLKNGDWEPVPALTDSIFTMQAFLVNPGKTTEFSIDWEWLYGELPDGCYRVVKSFSNNSSRGIDGKVESRKYYAEFAIGTPEGKPMLSLGDVLVLAKLGEELSWSSFEAFDYQETGSGLYIRAYDIDERFHLLIGGSHPGEEPMYIYLRSGEESIDIRGGGVEEFIAEHENLADGERSKRLMELESFLNSMPANGMLCCEYENVSEVCLRELIYQCQDEAVSMEDAAEAYKKYVGPLDLDLSYMSGGSLDKLLKSFTGYGMDEKSWDLSGVTYIPEADLYCIQHGDTNYWPVTCRGYEAYGDGLLTYYVSCERLYVTVKDNGDGSYQFISCVFHD